MKKIFKTTEEFNKFIEDEVLFNENYTIKETKFYENFISARIYQTNKKRGISGAIIHSIIKEDIDITYISKEETNNLLYIRIAYDNAI